MSGKIELILLLAGFLLFIVDQVTDIIAAVEYRCDDVTDIIAAAEYGQKCDNVWSGWTLTLVLVPLFFVSFMATVQITDNCDCCCLMFSYPFSIFVRFFRLYELRKQTYMNSPCGEDYNACDCRRCAQYREGVHDFNESTYEFVWIHYLRAITGSAPQWCLQVYIVFRQRGLPWYTLLSVVFSFFSLAWSITNLERARVRKEGREFKVLEAVVFFALQLFTLFPRLLTIVIFAYVFESFVFYLLLLHWVVVTVIIMRTESVREFRTNEFGNGCCGCVAAFFVFFILSFPFLFHASKTVLKWLQIDSDTFYYKLYGVMSAQSYIFTLVAIFIVRPGVAHLNKVGPVAVSFVTVSAISGAVLLVVHYYKYHQPREDVPA